VQSRSEWVWKDEGELADAVRVGVLSQQYADEIRAEGERVVAMIARWDPPFSDGWEDVAAGSRVVSSSAAGGLGCVNVHGDDLEPFVDRPPFSSRRKRLVDPAAARIGASVWEIAPRSTQIPYHFHHLQQELARRAERAARSFGRRPASASCAKATSSTFPTGPEGAHTLRNDTDERARVLWISELADAEIAEYPDSGKARVVTRAPSQSGERLANQFRLADDVDYLEGERMGAGTNS
jgi:uncharacterized cupin superfamily protein